jgi:hypothetical protein
MNFFAKTLITSLVASLPMVSILTQANLARAETYNGTKFTCVSQGNGNWATVGQRPGGGPITVITWTKEGSKYFGDNYTAQNRCRMVTPKFNRAVRQNGGRLKNVALIKGRVNNETVICVASTISRTGCNQQNFLFTLKPENSQKANEIVAQLTGIGKLGSSAGVVRETTGRLRLELSEVLDQNDLKLRDSDKIRPPADPDRGFKL